MDRRRGDARGLRRRRHRAVLGRRRRIARARAAGRRTRRGRRRQLVARGAWKPDVPLVVSQVNADDLAWHHGIVANPNCSTMQLAPLLAALRDAVGLERVIVDTYQAVSGTGADATAEFQAQIEAHVSGARVSSRASIRTGSRSTRCRRSTFSSTTATPRKSGRSSRRVGRSCTCPTCASHARPCASRCSCRHSEAVHVETYAPISAGRGARAVRRRPGRRASWTIPRRIAYPLATTRRAVMRSSSGGSAPTRRCPTAVASRCGWSATTCARARRRTRSRSRSCWSSGSARETLRCERASPATVPSVTIHQPTGSRPAAMASLMMSPGMNGDEAVLDRPRQRLVGRDHQPRHADQVDHAVADEHRADRATDLAIPAELGQPADDARGEEKADR